MTALLVRRVAPVLLAAFGSLALVRGRYDVAAVFGVGAWVLWGER
jgi:hypothetical protein